MSKSNKICGIYKITLTINGKFYIGSSSDIKTRFNRHKSTLRLNKHENKKLQRSWNKYGEENFVFEMIETCEPVKEIILHREQFYIDLLNPYFNICKIAGITMLGRKHKESTKKKQSESKRGKLNHMFGIKRPDSYKNKMKEYRLKNNHHMLGKFGKDNACSKKYIIISPDLNIEVIIGLSHYCRHYKLDQGSMGRIASGKRKTHKGYKCFYYTEEKYQELLETYKKQYELYNAA